MPDIRNVLLIGHGDSGKTTLAEAILAAAKATPRRGRVEDGTATSDSDPEEKDRKSSVLLSLLHAGWKGAHLNLLDAPGYLDFIAEAMCGIQAVETALVAVSASAGVMVGTRRAVEIATERGVSIAFVLTKADHENARVDEVLGQMRELFGPRCVPATLPIGQGPGLQGVASVLAPPGKLAGDAKETFRAAAEQLTEKIVEAEDSVLERYLGGETIPPEEIRKTFAKAVAKGAVWPIYTVVSPRDLGVEALLDDVKEVFPGPAAGRKRAGVRPGTETPVSLEPLATAPFSAQVFKVVTDPYVGRISYLRIVSGALSSDTSVQNARTGKSERIAQMARAQGKDQTPLGKAEAGDIVAIPRIETLALGDTLHEAREAIQYPLAKFPVPMVSLAVEPKARGDEAKISGALQRLADEDPCFAFRRDAVTKEMVISGLSQLHLDVLLRRCARRFKVEVVTRPAKIPYQETITAKGDARYRHRKQTGGAGQFAEVWLRIEPKERGAGFEFADDTTGGSIPKQYIPSCEKGIRGVLETGAIAGYPIVDVRAAVYDGKDHPVDSKDIAFQIAARMAFKEAMKQAKPALLEPIVKVAITVPSKFLGEITGDLNGRRGRILGMDTRGDQTILTATVPLAEVQNYSTDLRSVTGGEGSYTMEPSHYEIVPSQVAKPIIERAATGRKDEEEEG